MKPHVRRFLLALFWLVELPLIVLGALLALAWFWSGSDESLASALSQASRYLPAGQTLVAEDVRGSLRHGGHIGSLRWEKNGLAVQARQVDLVWRPIALLNRRLQLDTLRVAELRIDDRSPSSAAAPLDNLVLPFEVDVSFAVDRLHWAGPPALEASTLAGHYQFDTRNHVLKLTSARVADGSYQAQATLLARAPMTLDLQLQGEVKAPTGSDRTLALDAAASLRGDLAGQEVLLDLSAHLRPDKAGAGAAMRATVTAQISPWAAQPIRKAQADFTQLDLAAFLKDAPQTLLTGSAQVQPQGKNWQAQIKVDNRLAGPIDKGRIPVDSANARVEYSAGRWNIESLDVDGSGGRVQAQGALGDAKSLGALSGWQVQAKLQAINPALIHSELAPARLNGELRASASNQTVTFDTTLQPSGAQPVSSPLQGVRLQSAAAKGQWSGGWLQLQSLDIKTDDARLQGQVDFQPANVVARGRLQLTAPGADAKMSGLLGPQEGKGEMLLQISDAVKAARWSQRLPGVPQLLAQTEVQGNADLTLQWQGGWQALLRGTGPEPSLQLTVKAPRLDLHTKGDTPAQNIGLRDLVAELSGPITAMTLTTRGTVLQGSRRAQFQAQALGGRSGIGGWKAAVNTLRIQAQDSQRPGPWTLNLRRAVGLELQANTAGSVLTGSAGEADLTGPVPGAATLVWQPLRWSGGVRTEFTSKGTLRGLGLPWLDLLGASQLTNLGLSGDMMFDADWDVTSADTLKLHATLVRRSGDIRVQTDTGAPATVVVTSRTAPPATINAGVRDARITVDADGDTLRAALLWDSERAGNAQAAFSTRIARSATGWDWPADAPLSATVRASLPQVGVWSVLAPPGWRMRGTLEANMTLSGTRSVPQWGGTLQADDLGLRSVVDGIEFGNGRLRAALRGQRLDISEFTLQGAGGAAGGEVSAKGFAVWLPLAPGANPALTQLKMELDATAKALRVSARADRRLVVSGTMQARLDNARLAITGALKADQALFILPDETAPSLSSDVVIKSRQPVNSARAPSAAAIGPNAPDARESDDASASPGRTGLIPGGLATPATKVMTQVAIALDLGPDFRIQGRGISTRLAGTLQLRSAAGANDAPRLTGEVRTVQGSYKAYGQQLDIEQGVLRFLGAYDNPALDILAIRPNLSQRVGVQITGTALAPRVRLYSEPELAEAEKLAWLVLGRSGANGGAEAAVLQQAAMALLGRNGQGMSGGIASRLGLDELSFSGSSTKADGTTTSGATVTLGKRLSRNFYVAYERSLAGTLGTFSIFYDLSQRFTLRARTGEQSAIDLIFTYSYD